MIGIISQNNIIREAVMEILKDFPTESYQENHHYQLIIALKNDLLEKSNPSAPVITLGYHFEQEIFNLPLPIHPNILIQKVSGFYQKVSSELTFENNTFQFYKNKRCLILKEKKENIPLTEKENEILTCLAEKFPQTVKKEELLQQVWNYHQGTETHTVESHIYALRQKLGNRANSLIQSSPIGYSLVE